jgi:hypothetical protein
MVNIKVPLSVYGKSHQWLEDNPEKVYVGVALWDSDYSHISCSLTFTDDQYAALYILKFM